MKIHLLENRVEDKIDINQFVGKNKALFSIFAGSRISEINVLMPIFLNFIKYMEKKYNDITYVFHSTKAHNLSWSATAGRLKVSHGGMRLRSRGSSHRQCLTS